MDRLRDSGWQFVTTTIISLVSLLFTILTFQGNDSLRFTGIVVVIILIFGIVVINVLPTSKVATQSPNANAAPAPARNIQPAYDQRREIAPPLPPIHNAPAQFPYQYPIYQQALIYTPPPPGTAVPARKPSRLTPMRLWLLILALIGFISYIIAVAIINGGTSTENLIPIGNVFLVIGDVLLIGIWLIGLIDAGRLGYWGRFTLTLFLGWFGIFTYIFFVPTVSRKAFSQPYNQPYNQHPYNQQYGRR